MPFVCIRTRYVEGIHRRRRLRRSPSPPAPSHHPRSTRETGDTAEGKEGGGRERGPPMRRKITEMLIRRETMSVICHCLQPETNADDSSFPRRYAELPSPLALFHTPQDKDLLQGDFPFPTKIDSDDDHLFPLTGLVISPATTSWQG